MALILSGDTGVPASGMPAGSVIQTVQTVKSDTWSTTSNVLADIAGMSVSITPQFSNSKILVTVQLTAGTGDARMNLNLYRGATAIYVGDSASSRKSVSAMTTYTSTYGASGFPLVISYLDSPSTTSSTTYKLMAASDSNGYATYVNRSHNDSDSSTYWRSASSITVQEIKV